MVISAGEKFISGPYDGNGVAVEFDYDFKIFTPDELLVTRRNVDGSHTTLTEGVDFTVQGAGVDGGGKIILSSGSVLPSGARLTIEPAIERSQTRPLSAQSSMQLSEMEQALDKVTALTRQMQGPLDRAFKLDSFGTGIHTVLPPPEPGQGLFANDDADGFVWGVTQREIKDAGDFAAEAKAARDKARDWAESPNAPGGAGTKSSKTWAEKSEQQADRSEDEADRAEQEADRARDEANRSDSEADRAEGEADRATGQANRADNEADRAEGEADRATGQANRAEGEADRAEQEADRADQEADRADQEADRAKAWAESPNAPGGAGTKSSKTWASEAKQDANRADQEADRARDEANRSDTEADRAEGEADRATGQANRADNEADRAEGEADRATGQANRAEGEADRAEDEADRAQMIADGIGDPVAYTEQVKTPAEQAIARENIGVTVSDAVLAKLNAAKDHSLATWRDGEATEAGLLSPELLATLVSAPIGQLSFFGFTTPPDGWLVCDGRAITSLYPELRQALIDDGYKWGQDGSGNPRIPNAEDGNRFLRAAGGDLPVGTVQEDAIRNITAGLEAHYRSNFGPTSGAFDSAGSLSQPGSSSISGSGAEKLLFDASRVVPTANENRPKAIAALLCIKAFGSVVNIPGQAVMDGWLNQAKADAQQRVDGAINDLVLPFGEGYEYVDVFADRIPNTPYLNTTGHPMAVYCSLDSSSSATAQVTRAPVFYPWVTVAEGQSNHSAIGFIVLPGYYYRVTSSPSRDYWTELRRTSQ